jgi:hypothetical protein
METYDNEYTKEENYMMWELHQIREKMAEEGIDVDRINREAENYLKRNNLKVVKIIHSKEEMKRKFQI